MSDIVERLRATSRGEGDAHTLARRADRHEAADVIAALQAIVDRQPTSGEGADEHNEHEPSDCYVTRQAADAAKASQGEGD